MRMTRLALTVLTLATSAWSQADILYYKFDEAGGGKVVNYAGATGLAPREGSVVTTDVAAFAPGRLGAGALRGSSSSTVFSFVESGGIAALSGSFSVAFFLKARSVAPTGTNYFFGSSSSGSLFRGYTGGSQAGTSLLVRNWGGSPTDLKSVSDIVTPALTAWVHVALVVDSSGATATFYLNGVAEPPVPIGGSTNVPALTTFRVNNYTTSAGASLFDLDEFRLVRRAASAIEVLVWSGRTSPADAAYGAGCGTTLASSGGPPALGNGAYALVHNGSPGTPYALMLGNSRLVLGGVPLPFDLGLLFPGLAGCKWESSAELSFGGTTNASGIGTHPLPIPNIPWFDGAALWAQAFAPSLAQPQTSNPFTISLGR